MKGEWCYFKEYFTKEICDKILELGLQIDDTDASLGVKGLSENTNEDYRRSKIRFIHADNPDFKFLFEEIWKLGIVANRDWFNFHITNLSFIQLAEYDESYQGEYKKHHDVFWINNDIYHRKLTCVIQLTDPNEYEGGNLELFDLHEQPKYEELIKQGTVILFPSFIPHQVHPVTKGKRYSLSIWFEGPKWV
jgi:PKHD-type hydroxylase